MFDDHEVKIIRCDNGYIVEWRVPEDGTKYSIASPGYEKKTRGTEVFTSRKKAMEFANAKLSDQ